MSRSSSSTQLALPDNKRIATLQACGKHTKTSTIQMLKSLENAGLLDTVGTSRQLRSTLQAATEAHSKAITPYGPVVQPMKIDHPRMKFWDVANPMAWLWHCCSISSTFSNVMKTCSLSGRPLRIVLYGDSMCPGNPFRPEKSRTLMCLYWAIVDWPSHILSRTFAWPVFSVLRSTLIESTDGKMSCFARVLLRIFFGRDGPSFTTGFMLPSPDGPYMVKGIFAGWLADLVGHKEITEWKGTSGNRCCIPCHNLHAKKIGVDANGDIGLDCHDRSKWILRSDSDVYAIIDDLVVKRSTMGPTAFTAACTDAGWNIIPNGLLLDFDLRDVYLPVSHCIVDWQHTMCQDGVGNSCLAATLLALEGRGFTLNQVQTFVGLVNLPSKYGKVRANEWLGKNRLKRNKMTLNSFSGIILNLVPCVYLFIDKFCKDDPAIVDVVRMFTLLHMILGVLATGPEAAPRHAEKLRRDMVEFHSLALHFWKLKPKIHHMHHIVDGMLWLGKLLSCFVTERKHRVVKDSALHVMRHIEHTVVADVINTQCVQLCDRLDLWKKHVLIEPRELPGVQGVTFARSAILACGFVKHGDIVWCQDAQCCRVVAFYVATDDEMFVSVERLGSAGGLCTYHEKATTLDFIDVRSIVDAVVWYLDADGIIKIVIPPIAIYNV